MPYCPALEIVGSLRKVHEARVSHLCPPLPYSVARETLGLHTHIYASHLLAEASYSAFAVSYIGLLFIAVYRRLFRKAAREDRRWRQARHSKEQGGLTQRHCNLLTTTHLLNIFFKPLLIEDET